ncbi:MAG TPA: hypothetical protein VFX96_10475 [Pyrinomonadaceae bacterium]|nr:hypothetical protein [Pyrinomonadaceae bacterium]
MLFIQSNSLDFPVGARARLRLLDALAERGHAPLILSSRRRLFRTLAAGAGDSAAVEAAARELERALGSRHGADGEADATPGELFCAGDCVLALLFRDDAEGGLSASVVYSVETAAPLARLEQFCRDVREALAELKEEAAGAAAEPTELPSWRAREGGSSQGLARFIAVQPAEFVRAAATLRGGRELGRASALLEEQPVRAFLRRAQEMRSEGFTPRSLLREAAAVSVERMLEAGLLEREVRVSCRKSGHALFDLPSPDSLAAVTLSRAKCSLCAAPVADEVIEETVNPTRLAVALLEDGRWLSSRVYGIVRSLGIPASEIATGPANAHGESYLAADVCGNSFLFVARDGDLTPAFSRRIAETVEETDATHLVVVTTGASADEGRLRLYEFAWRRARAGRDLDTTLVEGLAGAREQIQRAFERVVGRELSRRLFPLDAALGFSAGGFVLQWFRFARASGANRRAGDSATPTLLDRQIAS